MVTEARNRSGRPTRRLIVATSAVVMTFSTLLVPQARAGTLDQSQPVISNVGVFVSNQFEPAQTFTAGTGGRLDQVDIAVARAGASSQPLQVEIRAVIGGAPSNTQALANASVAAASIPVGVNPSFISVPFASPAPVSAGTQYAIVVSSASCGFANCYVWGAGPAGSSYAAGSGFQSVDSGATWPPLNAFGSMDLAFKTYVARVPTGAAECKRGGWKAFTSPPFKNQGQCVAYVNHHAGRGQDDAKSQGAAKNQGAAKAAGKGAEPISAGGKKGSG
jgi:hypothetical protein